MGGMPPFFLSIFKNFALKNHEAALRISSQKQWYCVKTPETFQTLTTLLLAKTSPEIVLLTTLLPDALRYSCAFSASLS